MIEDDIKSLLGDMICITPYIEIRGFGNNSIYDYVDKNQIIDPDVIAYLQTTTPFMMSPGVYAHPFKQGVKLLGPYWYTDGTYVWDRDTWKYVVKYGLKVPDYFVEHVHSQKGKAFLDEFYKDTPSWKITLYKWKKEKRFDIDCLPDDAGDKSIEDF